MATAASRCGMRSGARLISRHAEDLRRDYPNYRCGRATIMMLSSSGQLVERANGEAIGVAHYPTKPIDQRELLTTMGRVLAVDRLPPPALSPTMVASELPERRLHVLVAEDNVVNQRIASAVLQRRGHHVTIADNGRAAVTACEREASCS